MAVFTFEKAGKSPTYSEASASGVVLAAKSSQRCEAWCQTGTPEGLTLSLVRQARTLSSVKLNGYLITRGSMWLRKLKVSRKSLHGKPCAGLDGCLKELAI